MKPLVPIFCACIAFGGVLVQAQNVQTIQTLSAGRQLGLDPTKHLTQYQYDHWTTEHGLPSNGIQGILQTRDGYIWIATFDGLARFDGVRFTVFNQRNTPILPINSILSICEASDGAVWLGSSGGGLYRYSAGKFTVFGEREGLQGKIIRKIVCDTVSKKLWLATNKGVVLLDPGNGETTPPRFTPIKGLEGEAQSVFVDSKRRLWVLLPARGVFVQANPNDSAQSITSPLQPSFSSPRQIIETPDGKIWIGTQDKGLFFYQHGVIKQYISDKISLDRFIYGLFTDSWGTLWIGDAEVFSRLSGSNSDTIPETASANLQWLKAVQSLVEDNEGNLWVGSYFHGLTRICGGKFLSYSMLEGLPSATVHCVSQDADSTVWIGTEQGIALLSAGKIRLYNALNNALPSKSVRHIYHAHDGTLWIATTGGVVHFDKGKAVSYTTKDGLSNNNSRAIHEDRHGTVWVGTRTGLNRLVKGTFVRYANDEGLMNAHVTGILEDQDSILWISTANNGIFSIRPDSSVTHRTKRDGLPSDVVFHGCRSSDGSLWFGSNAGLIRKTGNVWMKYTEQDGLPTSTIFEALEDRMGYLWLTTPKGIARIHKRQFDEVDQKQRTRIEYTSFTKNDGMRSDEVVSIGGCCVGQDGMLWFPTVDGIEGIHPLDMHTNTLVPPVYIERLIGNEASYQLDSCETNPSLRLASINTDIQIEYTALSLISPNKVLFKYKLEGFDNDWKDVGARRIAYYTNLPRGREYRFRVIACNNDGVWNETGAAVEFSVNPYFYETWWFYGLCGIMIILLVLGIYYARVRQLEYRAKTLENTVAARTAELSTANKEIQTQLEVRAKQTREIELVNTALQERNETLSLLNTEKNELMAIVAHDLKNPIGAIRGLADIVQSGDANSDQAPSIAGQIVGIANRMLELVKNLLDANQLESGAMRFQVVRFDIAPHVEGAVWQYRHSAEAKNITVHYAAEASSNLVYADEQAIIQVIDNLLSNAIKYSPQGRRVFVKVVQKSQTVRIEVQDEGQGISEEDRKQLFGKFARLSARPTGGEHSTGLGLSITKKLVEAMNGKVWCESEPGNGATFIVELPTSLNHLESVIT